MRGFLPALLLLFAPLAFAQNQTIVTGTLTDPNGVPYYPATVSACLTPATLYPMVAGQQVNNNPGSNYCFGPVSTASNGSFLMSLWGNALITCNPACPSTQWLFTVVIPGPVAPVGFGPQQFTATITISGSSQDIGATLNAAGVSQLRPAGAATNATNLVGPGSITGTFSGTHTLTGNVTYQTGTLNSNNLAAGNVANKYAGTSQYRYVDGAGSDSNDGLSMGTAFATPQKCITIIEALGSGVCDARSMATFTITSEIDVGISNTNPVILLLPPSGTWTCNLTGGTNYCIKVFSKSQLIGTGTGEGQPFQILASSTANVDSVCGSDPVATGQYVRLEGFTCNTASGATVATAVCNFQRTFDQSYFGHISCGTNSTSATKVLWAHRLGFTTVEMVVGEGNNVAGAVPCTFGGTSSDGNGSTIVRGGSCVHPGATKNNIVIQQNATNGPGNHYSDIYLEETGSDLTAAAIAVTMTGGGGFADVIEGMRLVDVASSTRYLVDIAAGANVILRDIVLGNTSPNAVNDHNTGRVPVAPGIGSHLGFYDSQAFNPFAAYFSRIFLMGPITSSGSGLVDLGTTGLPFANLWLGTAGTNNFKLQPTATTGARTWVIPDWGANGSSTQNQPFVITLTSQYTNSTTTFSNVAGGNTIQFAVAANSNYTATCHLYYQAAATGGLNIEFTGPASPTAVRYGMDLPTAITGVASGEADAFGTSIGAVSTAGAVNLDAMVSFSLLNGANAGTVNLLAKSSAAVQLQIQSGSWCRIQ